MNLQFDKYSAHGNDFIVIDNRNNNISTTHYDLFRKLCQRRTSVGADGVIIINTDKPDFTADFFNADGFPAQMCGNGARVAVECARRWGVISKEARFWVQGKVHQAKVEHNSSIGVEIHLKSQNSTTHRFTFQGNDYIGFLYDTGVPHVVFINIHFNEEESINFARMVRSAPEFSPDGVNVNFIHTLDKHTVSIKTYERGVETFTLSCGTGAVAAVCAGRSETGLKLPVSVRSEGGTLLVSEADDPNSLWIWGTIEKVYSGVIENINCC